MCLEVHVWARILLTLMMVGCDLATECLTTSIVKIVIEFQTNASYCFNVTVLVGAPYNKNGIVVGLNCMVQFLHYDFGFE